MKNTKTSALVVVAAIALLLALAGGYAVGRHRSTSAPAAGSSVAAVADRASATGHNAADVTFAQMMTPHHTQAIDMAQLATTRAGSPAVKALAAQIAAAQQPEIDAMTGWLQDWKASASTSHGHGMAGMMSEGDMSSLETRSGTAFDTMFLTMMIQHHDGAIAMAKSELAAGKSSDALALATSIQVTQQAQVAQMKQLLRS